MFRPPSYVLGAVLDPRDPSVHKTKTRLDSAVRGHSKEASDLCGRANALQPRGKESGAGEGGCQDSPTGRGDVSRAGTRGRSRGSRYQGEGVPG